jgi:hypothetical protein
MALQPEPIDDKRVQGILDHARDLARTQTSGLSMLDLDKAIWQVLLVLRRWDDTPQTPLSRVEADPSWKSLLRLPQKPLDSNFDLMAAEHYSYARFVAAFYGDPHTETALKTYFAAKSALSHFKGGEKLLRTTPNHPVLPESDASLRWMSLGVVQGLNDYRAANGGQLGKPWSSRDVVTQNVGPQYQRAKDSAGVRPYAQGAGG